MEQSTRMTIFISSPNEYSDVFDVFYKFYEKNLKDCSFPIVLATNTNEKEYEGIKVYRNGITGDSWTSRAIPVLREINTKYILVMCDDLFVEELNESKLNSVLSYMDEHDVNFCRIAPLKKGKKALKNPKLRKVKKNLPYGINLQIGIYNREYLLEMLGDGTKSAWQIESDLVEATLNAKNEYFDDVIACGEPVVRFIHGVVKGQWLPSALRKIEKYGINVVGERKVMSRSQERKIAVKGAIGALMPVKMRYVVKKLLGKCGVKFATKN